MNLKHKVALQKESNVKNCLGEVSSDWEKIRDMRVSIIPVSGNESFLSHTDFSKVTHKIKCRYRQDINASMRLSFDDRGVIRIFRIISVINARERKQWMEIRATEDIN